MAELPLLSPVVAGLWRLDSWALEPAERARWIRRAVELGLSTLDLAEIYGGYSCHARVGEALRADPGLRDAVRLVTKFGIEVPKDTRPGVRVHHYDTSAARLAASVEAALSELGTDHLDLLLVHRWDPLLDAAELAEACAREQAAGRVLRFGVSNFAPSTMRLMDGALPGGLATNQVELHPLHLEPFEDGTTDLAQELDLPLMAWSPLAGGRLFQDGGERAIRVRTALAEVAQRHGAEIDQVAFAFLLRHPARIHPITGTGNLERLARQAAAVDITLDREDWFTIWTASKGAPLP
jgi:predicted oxidoreductase